MNDNPSGIRALAPVGLGLGRWCALLFVGLLDLLQAPAVFGQSGGAGRVVFSGSHMAVPVVAIAGITSSTIPAISRTTLTAAEVAAPMDVELVLAMHNFSNLQARVHSGETIPAAEMAGSYLPSAADYQTVLNWIAGEGLTVTRTDPNHVAIFAQGSVSQMAQIFGVNFVRVTFANAEYSSASTAPSLPAPIAGLVLSVNGLQPHLRPAKHALQPLSTTTTTAAPYWPRDILRAYGGSGLTQTGAGQTIGIVIDTFPKNSDLTNFWSTTGVPQTLSNMEFIQVVNGRLPGPSGEETLDVEWASGMAPGAKVRVYGTVDLSYPHLDQAYAQIYSEVSSATEPTLHQISLSYGLNENQVSSGQLQTDEQYFAELAAAGVTVCAAAGDGGGTSGRPVVEAPASSFSVTAVGGTSLKLNRSTGAVTSEAAWSGTVGGASSVFARPPWQTGAGVPAGSTRLVPDVAAPADPNLGALVFLNGSAQQFGGTSWSSPTWAAICALINQTRAGADQAALGLLGPKIYPLLGTAAFRAITSGSNGAFSAGPGYDELTGVGVPVLPALVGSLTNAPVVTSNPVNQTVAPGRNAVFAVAGTGTVPLTFHWQLLAAGSSTFGNLSDGTTFQGSTTAALSVTAVTAAMNGDQFRCVLANASGSATSLPATLVVTPPAVTNINPTTESLSAAGASNVTVTVSSNTTWTVTSSVPWITSNVSFGTNNGTVRLNVAANLTGVPRTGTVTIDGQNLTVSEAAAVPVVAINPGSVNLASAGSPNILVNVTSNTTWSVSPAVPWITVANPGSGAGNGRVALAAAANPATISRSGTVAIGTQTFTVNEAAAPAVTTVSPGTEDVVAAGATGVTLSVSSNTTWTVSSNAAWIVPNVTTGTGNGSVMLTVATNTAATSRTGNVTINQRTVMVNQAGTPGFVTINPGSEAVGSAGASNLTVTVSSNTAWTVSSSVLWVQTNLTSGFGNGVIHMAVQANPATATRSGTVTIGGQILSMTQAAAPPTTTISPGKLDVAATGASAAAVKVTSNVAWTVSTGASWIVPNVTSGSGSGTVLLAIAANASTAARSGTVTIGTQTLSVQQAGVRPFTNITPGTENIPSTGAIGVTVTVSSNTSWTVNTNASWIIPNTAAGTGSGTFTLTVAANPSRFSRLGVVLVNNVALFVIEAGAPSLTAAKLNLLFQETSLLQNLTPAAVVAFQNWVAAQQGWFAPSASLPAKLTPLPNSAAIGVWLAGVAGGSGQNLPAPLTAAEVTTLTSRGLPAWWSDAGAAPTGLGALVDEFLLAPWAVNYGSQSTAIYLDPATGDIYIEALDSDGKTVESTLRLPAAYVQSLGL